MLFRDLAGNAFPELGQALAGDAGALEVAGLSSDSRKITPGMVFVAIPGTKADGSRFIADAAEKGAALVVAAGSAENVSVPVLTVGNPRLFLALAASRFYGRQPETMAAVTGTAGKTSVASFTRQIWALAGLQAAMIGTTGVIAPGRSDYGSLTTPDPAALHALLAELSDAGVTHAAMEASSHGLDQYRLDGVRLAAGAFTNLGRDHMDYHPTVEDYFAAKMHLFDRVLPKGSPAIINADDPWSERAVKVARDAGHDVLTVGRNGTFLTLKRVEQKRDSQFAEISHGSEIFEVRLPLAGEFQISNALVAAGIAIATGVEAKTALAALESIEGAAGRLQLAGRAANGALAYVDYAHKPDALEKVLASVRPFTTGRVLVVFGCGGDRDTGKRPIMGEIATRLADVVIVTDDNPRSEEPASIRSEIMKAAPGATEIGDRHEAIAFAVSQLQQGDTLIVAGKGHEEGQTAGGVTRPFSDLAEVRKALEGISS
ncbi:UDP-N-acetylmuramoyl-L-alanyl-D-glutamate--2,6-diaminopimelate ligase [Martelella mediterranea]|uniref:UDP-N-acetylmuramoyl-L-alanyl-D-glutamate--2,6-diaminopimelate ligase n=1 Tax=Martelella mediterranea TaxID=293089 RepID=A0A4R3NWU5_9HYPH|nr:UDP-N-acetylmuramoyl-L-alanyl-D-glutamate--2,6-diaminopimelate ligase [Martelella mediterranea]TCT43147.1 UDP-N-acetylmuramoylalanyl-D-glutamate--2,6-diaminopimelate ligase [Martelella mediterranea]